MAYRANPFLERMSERTTSDQEFIRRFSPKIFDRLAREAFESGVHIFRSPPGGGKTTLLRSLTPPALRAFWNARHVQETADSYNLLRERGLLHETMGPQLLGVFLSCAAGYADLPPGATPGRDGLFRALLDCRIVLRTLRNLAALLGRSPTDGLVGVELAYDEASVDLKSIPLTRSARELVEWAEQRERSVYAKLEPVGTEAVELPIDVRFEGVLWLQGVGFYLDGVPVAPKRLLMIDDLQKLRRRQRAFLLEEITELRPTFPVWLAERSIALGDDLLSQGVRQGRDVREWPLDQLWSGPGGQYQFAAYVQNILDRRLDGQTDIPSGSFTQYLSGHLSPDELRKEVEAGVILARTYAQRYSGKTLYREWVQRALQILEDPSMESLREFYVTRILISRDEGRRQLALELAPLSTDEMDERGNSQVLGAADIFMNDELRIPYFFGIERLCLMATNNVEEMLSLAAALFEALRAKQVLRKLEFVLSPHEQERIIRDVAKRKREFIPKSHTEGTRAQRLLDSIGTFCRDRTFLPSAPYAPGVTGIRLSQTELGKLHANHKAVIERVETLRRVMAECVAENLLVPRASMASTTRDSGTVFYLNRTLCVHYGLPLQMGGWQDVTVDILLEWIEHTPLPARRRRLELH
jgi:hypothetical protein